MRPFRSLLLLCAVAAPLSAQVGHDPATSPFRDIRNGRWLEFYTGQIGGSGGPIPVGPRDGTVFGGRIDFRGRNTLQISFGAWYAATVRNIVDADDSIATRIKPAIKHSLFGGDANIQLNLTGGKSYRGIAPYVGFGLGVVKGQKTPAADTSGYSFGTKFYFSPSAGTRLMLGQRLFLKAEGRLYFWSLKYPLNYSDEPAKQPGTGDVFNAVNPTGRRSQYVTAPALLIGAGFAF